jgi:transposase
VLGRDPVSGHVFCFRGRRGDLVKLLWWDGEGLCLYAKRLEWGLLVWPRAEEGMVVLSRAQVSMLLEGIDCRMPRRTWRPELAGEVIGGPCLAGPVWLAGGKGVRRRRQAFSSCSFRR